MTKGGKARGKPYASKRARRKAKWSKATKLARRLRKGRPLG